MDCNQFYQQTVFENPRMDLLQILEKSIAPDQQELEAAQRYLEQAAEANLPQLLIQLAEILRNGGRSAVARMQAGIQLKNALYSKDPTIKTQYQQRWLAFSEPVRLSIKSNVIAALGTEEIRPSTAAQCVAYIACAELPNGLWPDLMNVLLINMTNPASTELMKEATLEAVGYICQDINPDVLQSQSNEILTAIVHGMSREEPSNHVRLAATNALLNSLEFTKANFDREAERHFIMQVVCEASQCPDVRVKVAALQCLVKIMTLYYVYMEHYMGPALFAITIEAMKSDVDEIALQGIEFWSSVCDEEVDLAIEYSEAQETGRPPERTSKFYAKGALSYLVPILTHKMTRQDEVDDDDEWNPCKAAGVCLMLMANCCENDVVDHILSFVTGNINSPDWKCRDAAVMAFGSTLEGPDPDKLKPIVEQAIPMLISLMRDTSPVVRDTVAWTIGRVCELLPEAAVNPSYLVPLVEGLVRGLEDVPRVAANVCWAFSSLAEAAYEAAEGGENGEEPATYCMSAAFTPIVEKLLATTDRPDGNLHNLRAAAYEALMEMIKNSPVDCYTMVRKTTVIIIERLQRILQLEGQIHSNSDRAQYNDMQSLLCATLQSVLKKVTREDAPLIADHVMGALLQMLQTSSATAAGGVQEDALLAVSALIEVLGENFLKYMESFKPYLAMGLKNVAEYQVCLVAVNTVGDLCRSLTTQMQQYSDEIMTILLHIINNPDVDRTIKPEVLSVFGDIALALGPHFKIYLDVVLATLYQASIARADESDYDSIDYINELREGCLEAYTGIVQGLKGDKAPSSDVNLLVPYVAHIIQFIEAVAVDAHKSDGVVSAACGLIGDVAMTFGPQMAPLAEKEAIGNLLTAGRRSKTGKAKTLATWATKELKKLKTQS